MEETGFTVWQILAAVGGLIIAFRLIGGAQDGDVTLQDKDDPWKEGEKDVALNGELVGSVFPDSKNGGWTGANSKRMQYGFADEQTAANAVADDFRD